MEIFALGLVLGMLAFVALLLLTRKPATTQIVVLPPYQAPRRRARSPLGPIVWAIIFALALGAFLALWTRVSWAQPQAANPAARQAVHQPAVLSGVALPVATPTAVPTAVADAKALNEEGKALLGLGNAAQAETRFRQAMEAGPGLHEPYSNLAFCLYERGDIQEAISYWRIAVNINPDSPDANAGLGMALFATGRADEGRAHYERAIEIDFNYTNEGWMRTDRLWGARALADSRPLR